MSEVKEWRLVRTLIYVTSIFLVVYIASAGPVIAFLEDSNGNIPAQYYAPILTFYTPLQWTFENFPRCRDFYYEYYKIFSSKN